MPVFAHSQKLFLLTAIFSSPANIMTDGFNKCDWQTYAMFARTGSAYVNNPFGSPEKREGSFFSISLARRNSFRTISSLILSLGLDIFPLLGCDGLLSFARRREDLALDGRRG